MIIGCSIWKYNVTEEMLLNAPTVRCLDDIFDELPPLRQVFLGQQYVNSQTLSDVTFVIEDRKFFAHRIALLASSDAFRAMFEGTFREKAASEIPIPNIRYEIFERMMTCVYTGAPPRPHRHPADPICQL